MVIAAAFVLANPISAVACLDTADSNPYSYSDAWQSTHDDAFLVQLSGISSSGSLYIYDFGSPENDLQLFSDEVYANTNIYFSSIYFSSVDNEDGSTSWYADTVPGGQSLSFVSSPLFGFYFSNGSDSWQEYDLFGASGTYWLSEINTGMEVLVHDMEPAKTPIPAAVLLLGSGLVGIIALRRR